MSTVLWELKIQPNLYTQYCTQEFSPRKHYVGLTMLGVMFPCSNQGNHVNCIWDYIITNYLQQNNKNTITQIQQITGWIFCQQEQSIVFLSCSLEHLFGSASYTGTGTRIYSLKLKTLYITFWLSRWLIIQASGKIA